MKESRIISEEIALVQKRLDYFKRQIKEQEKIKEELNIELQKAYFKEGNYTN